ncbi:hypothetical protein B5F40_06345 [Gordonibacter sp. An230]|uniref:helix-turn-helix domain-containing protein n=1 Tax=Gordonibacter sp. An230 TaxID=1965592 RepID=UPI000B389A01|nr:helix-turn-helix transcriptional regulator [Gordonibacter sp. An230]OUO90573.1 hypothetical protein B5F40_06345 [Gordonibacter sp. An230]
MNLGQRQCAVDEGAERFRFAPVFAANVQRLRKQAKINKKRFALMVGIGRPFLDKIEDGTANPRLDVMVRIADALDTTPQELLNSPDNEIDEESIRRGSPSFLDMRHTRPL